MKTCKLLATGTATLIALAGLVTIGPTAGATEAAAIYYRHSHCTAYSRAGRTAAFESTCVTSSISVKAVTAREWTRVRNAGKASVIVREKCSVELWNHPGGRKHRTVTKRSAGDYVTTTVVRAGTTVAVQPNLCRTSVAAPRTRNGHWEFHVTGHNSLKLASGEARRLLTSTGATEELGTLFGDGLFMGAAGTAGCPAKYSPTFHGGKSDNMCATIA